MKNGLTKLNNRSIASVDAGFLCPLISFVKFGSMVTMVKKKMVVLSEILQT